ncbi:MAG: glycosyl transferase [Candidatus Sumerlaea sp.]|nr:MAG: glycosyl transferase [Candidatus Sumerlaea sp.]
MGEQVHRVLHLSTEKGWRGGERQVKLLTNGLMSRGIEIRVACPPDSELFHDRAEANVAIPWRVRSEFDPVAIANLISHVRRFRPQLIHAHTSHAHSIAWLAARFVGLPVVVSRRVDFSIASNWAARRKYLSSSVWFIAISEGVRNVLLSGGVDPDRVTVVHSGIELDRYPFRGEERDNAEAAKWGVQPHEYLLINVAALTDHKDQSTLLRAAAELRRIRDDWRLVIAGEGELRAHLERLVAELELGSKVCFAGYVRNLAPLYRAADLFVLSSHLEGLCTSLLDAMLAGVPVIATRTGGVPEVVEDGRTGRLVPPRDPVALAQTIAELLDRHELRHAYAHNAREKVEREFSAEQMVEGTLCFYAHVLEQWKSSP